MNDGSKLTLDAFLTLSRYLIIAYCLKMGVSDQTVMEAYIGLGGALVTILWGFQASGYWARLKEVLKPKE